MTNRIIRIALSLTLFLSVAFVAPATSKEAKKPKVRVKKKKVLPPQGPVVDRSVPDAKAIRLAIEDMTRSFPGQYTGGAAHLRRLEKCEKELSAAQAARDKAREKRAIDALGKLRSEALLANPLLDYERLLLLRRNLGDTARQAMSLELGMPKLNSHTHDTIQNPISGWDNEIVTLEKGKFTVLYKPDTKKMLCDIDLDFDADCLMFSSIGTHDQWHIFEMETKVGSAPRQLTPTDLTDVGHFDSCYLPDGDILFDSTASYQGLPCQYGTTDMACLYRLYRKTGKIRQLTFEQDSDWCPTPLNNGRVMYLRWEYPDTPHYFTRVLFHMNPDGTGQTEYYGSNSYFPNAFFFARPVPGHPTMVAGVAGGHHGISRSGRLLLIDPALGRHEADGVVQEIPGRGKKVEPIIRDQLVNGVWPQFIHPWPLSEKYHLAAVKPTPKSLWGIYLVDVFDNLTLIQETEGAALLEPIPLKARPRPPVIPPRVDLRRDDANVFLVDIYKGGGLANVPRGKVKRLRLYTYHFGYRGVGGHNAVGVESGWDVKRILGTVPVRSDGSALFRVPANTPIALQPLDEQGRALQWMRSWFTAMPGETLSCVGCHEKQNETAAPQMTLAARDKPSEIEPWYGPARGFGFEREVGPVLAKRCVGCHDGKEAGRPNFADWSPKHVYDTKNGKAICVFPQAYVALQPYVRRPGPESDYHMYYPMEYHASTSELAQMLKAGHHNVRLDAEEWDRLYTWIDLNAPAHGTWLETHYGAVSSDEIEPSIQETSDLRLKEIERQRARRIELAKRYAGVDDDPEAEAETLEAWRKRAISVAFVPPEKEAPAPRRDTASPAAPGWPFGEREARALQAKAGDSIKRALDLGDGLQMQLSLIPTGRFLMNNPATGRPRPAKIDHSFWLASCEVTNQQYAQFDPEHDSRYIDRGGKDHSNRGYPANEPDQPVIRVSRDRAEAFCRWLSERSGASVALPSEAQWEWAARAGSASDFWFGDAQTDFALSANLADQSAARLKTTPFPMIAQFNDRQMITAPVGSYRASPWGLHDMHGNVAEWTRASVDSDDAQAIARGGSWRDRPHRARAPFRQIYKSYQPVFNVGFRVAVEFAKATQSTQSGN